jgi:hypothetical protein
MGISAFRVPIAATGAALSLPSARCLLDRDPAVRVPANAAVAGVAAHMPLGRVAPMIVGAARKARPTGEFELWHGPAPVEGEQVRRIRYASRMSSTGRQPTPS